MEKLTKLFFLIMAIFFLVGATWPKNMENSWGADFEKTRTLCYQEPNLIGTDVVELQERLKELGFFMGKVDGVFSREVEQALRDFQKDNGLAVDGIAKKHVWYRLSDICRSPQSTKKDPPKGNVTIIIDTFKLKLLVLDDKEPYQSFPIAIGRSSTPTPIGRFKVVHKAVNWGTGFGTRWMGLNVRWGKFGIHGTNKPWSIGRMASHGCIRMRNSDVEKLYPWVKRGTEVIIVGNPFGRLCCNMRRLVKGAKGSDVVAVQERLKNLGYLEGKADGIFGFATEKAVKTLQKDNKFKVTGQIGWSEYKFLNL